MDSSIDSGAEENAMRCRIAGCLACVFPLLVPEYLDESSADLCYLAQEAGWKFHGGIGSLSVGGDGLASGDSGGSSTQLHDLAVMLVCVSLLESRQAKPRPVVFLGEDWSLPPAPPKSSGDFAGATGFAAYAASLIEQDCQRDAI